MAAVLKRRALAEFSRVIQDEVKVPQKRLRLTHKVPRPEPQLELGPGLSAQDVLNVLLQLEAQLPVDDTYVDNIVRTLLDHLYVQKEAHVKAKVIELLGSLAKTPSYDATVLIDSLTTMAKSETSHKVLSQLVSSLSVIGQSITCESRTVDQILTVAKSLLKDGSHIVRSRCLQLIGCLGTPEDCDQSEDGQHDPREGLQKLLLQYANDSDPRVRESSFEAIMKWHQRGHLLERQLYDQLVTALTDDYEGVRIIAVRLVRVMADLYPESLVPVPDSQEENRLVDDAFAKICNMVNDVAMGVRATAAGLLGDMHAVSEKFLEQTLDKKLMSMLRRKASAHERQKEHFQSGEWSSGQKWADDAPKELLDAESVSLMSSGACGAFVHGLEDEFLEVRTASIESMCSLAMKNARFAQLSQDFLVDMFNDEIESVRLKAIKALQRIGHHISLREDQLEIILGVLKDFSYDIRDGLKEMICSTRLATKGALYMCIMGLLENMKNYPQDRLGIWRSMQQIGAKHAPLLLVLVPELLSTHPYFDTPEPDMDDPTYIAVLILVFNGAKDSPTMPTLLPDHTIRHYIYIRDTLPEYVPKLRLPGVPLAPDDQVQESGAHASAFLDTTLQRLKPLPDLEPAAARQLIQLVVRDLERIHQVEPELAPTAECLSMYLQCQQRLSQISSNHRASQNTMISPQQLKQQKALLDKVIEGCQHMENLFTGFTVEELLLLRQMQLLARGLCLQMSQQRGLSTFNRQTKEFMAYLAIMESDLTESGIPPLPCTECLLQANNSKETDSAAVLKIVHKAVQLFRPSVLSLAGKLRRARVEVVEPSGQLDNTYSFTAGLALSIKLVADIDNVTDASSLRIKVHYPDQQCQLVVPRTSHLRSLSDTRHRLSTQVLLSHAVWSEPCQVKISVVKCFNHMQPIAAQQDSDVKQEQLSKAETELNSVELCTPIKVNITPKAVKR